MSDWDNTYCLIELGHWIKTEDSIWCTLTSKIPWLLLPWDFFLQWSKHPCPWLVTWEKAIWNSSFKPEGENKVLFWSYWLIGGTFSKPSFLNKNHIIRWLWLFLMGIKDKFLPLPDKDEENLRLNNCMSKTVLVILYMWIHLVFKYVFKGENYREQQYLLGKMSPNNFNTYQVWD
jgi:hypothetical protein